MTHCPQAMFKWFRAPPGPDWAGWRTTVDVIRPDGGSGGSRPVEGALECAAWIPAATVGPNGVPRARPLVIVLQGCGQDPDDVDDELGWYALAAQRRFAVLFIRETRIRAESGPWWLPTVGYHCFDWFDVEGARMGWGQPQGIVHALDRLLADHGAEIDRRAVYLAGFSAGAGMAGLLLTAWPERFAGAGMVAGPAIGVAESLSAAWSVYLSPNYFYWPETMRRWASDLRTSAVTNRGGKPKRHRHKVSIWHGDADPVVNRGHSVALVDQLAGMMEIPVTRQWRGLVMPRVEISGQTASHTTRALSNPNGGLRHTLNRAVFTRDGEALIQANWIDFLGHAVPVAHRRDADGVEVPETDRRRFVGIDSTSEILDFLGVA